MKKLIKKLSLLCIMILITVTTTACDNIHIYTKTVIDPTSTTLGYDHYVCTCGKEYSKNYTCLLSFNSKNITNSYTPLPQITNQTIPVNSAFAGIVNQTEFDIVEYRIYTSTTEYTILPLGEIIDFSSNITIVWQEPQKDKTATELTYDDTLSKVQKLEELSIAYNTANNKQSNPALRTLQYIRNVKYNTSAWNLLAGTIESDFSAYVDSFEESLDISTLQSLESLIIPTTNECIDFVHMAALMNVCYKTTAQSSTDLAGFLGDICQLAAQIDKLSITTDEDLFAKCEELFASNSSASSFSLNDLLADLDGINIIQKYKNTTNISLADTISNYYTLVNESTRKLDFITNTLSGKFTKQAIIEELSPRIYNNFLIKTWCNQNSFDLTQDRSKKIVNYLVGLFADYILS